MEKELEVYVEFLCSNYNIDDFRNFIRKRREFSEKVVDVESMFRFAIETRQPSTVGSFKKYFTYCCSRDYL